jgi:peptide alpha-N-acetyltransferase
MAISKMVEYGVEEVVLETESDNEAALGFYRKLGFVKEKRLYRFYMNAKDAFRLALPVPQVVRDTRRGGVETT